jgi:DNA-binding MarR family transcriptional regulator
MKKTLDKTRLGVYTRIIMEEDLKANELSRYDIAQCNECTAFNLKKATRIVQNLFDQAFKPIGLEGTQYTVLVHIFVHGPISLTRLAELMQVDRTTLARNLAPLEKKGFVDVKQGSDRRAKFINITPKGKEVLYAALPLWKKTQEEIKTALGLENWGSMISNLTELTSKLNGK